MRLRKIQGTDQGTIGSAQAPPPHYRVSDSAQAITPTPNDISTT